MKKFKCRPADPAYHADDYYTREVEAACPRTAAERTCERWFDSVGDYRAFDVQVLCPDGWNTFELTVHSVPEFEARLLRSVPPVPEVVPPVPCGICDRPLSAEDIAEGDEFCRPCWNEEAARDSDTTGPRARP